MRCPLALFAVLAVATVGTSAATLEGRSMPKGIDVSSYQPNVNWGTVKKNGVSFAYIKATEGHGMLPFKFVT